jgi:hypothetical protein
MFLDSMLLAARLPLAPTCLTSDNPAYVNQAWLDRTGFTLMPIHGRFLGAPEQKDDSDNTRNEWTLEGVGCRLMLSPASDPEEERLAPLLLIRS